MLILSQLKTLFTIISIYIIGKNECNGNNISTHNETTLEPSIIFDQNFSNDITSNKTHYLHNLFCSNILSQISLGSNKFETDEKSLTDEKCENPIIQHNNLQIIGYNNEQGFCLDENIVKSSNYEMIKNNYLNDKNLERVVISYDIKESEKTNIQFKICDENHNLYRNSKTACVYCDMIINYFTAKTLKNENDEYFFNNLNNGSLINIKCNESLKNITSYTINEILSYIAIELADFYQIANIKFQNEYECKYVEHQLGSFINLNEKIGNSTLNDNNYILKLESNYDFIKKFMHSKENAQIYFDQIKKDWNPKEYEDELNLFIKNYKIIKIINYHLNSHLSKSHKFKLYADDELSKIKINEQKINNKCNENLMKNKELKKVKEENENFSEKRDIYNHDVLKNIKEMIRKENSIKKLYDNIDNMIKSFINYDYALQQFLFYNVFFERDKFFNIENKKFEKLIEIIKNQTTIESNK